MIMLQRIKQFSPLSMLKSTVKSVKPLFEAKNIDLFLSKQQNPNLML